MQWGWREENPHRRRNRWHGSSPCEFRKCSWGVCENCRPNRSANPKDSKRDGGGSWFDLGCKIIRHCRRIYSNGIRSRNFDRDRAIHAARSIARRLIFCQDRNRQQNLIQSSGRSRVCEHPSTLRTWDRPRRRTEYSRNTLQGGPAMEEFLASSEKSWCKSPSDVKRTS